MSCPSRLATGAILAVALVVATGCAADPEPDEAPTPEAAPPEPDPVPDAEPAPPDDPADDDPPPTPDLDVALTLTEVATLGSAVAGAVGPGGELVLADRAGTVHVLGDDGLGPPIVDVADQTTTDGERGLLGITFAADGRELYVSYTDLDGDTVIEAFTLGEALTVRDRRVVLTHPQPFANHNGGDIAIGPDGYLYIALGDGGGGGDPLEAGQDLGSMLGAVLRIDPRGGEPYAVPADNPFVDDPDAADEIYAWGLRNPWRISFDRDTGALWIADVGQNSREEINLLTTDDAGANLGWNLMEGTLPFAGDEPDDHHRPVHEYETTSGRCSITGGFVYRGSAIPELVGAYLFSDYCEGAVRAIVVDDTGALVDEAHLGLEAPRIVSFAEDADGELYVLSVNGGVWRIDPA